MAEELYQGSSTNKDQVSAESNYNGYPPENLFDGDGSTAWMSNPSYVLPEWIQWDFGEDKKISQLRLQRRDGTGGWPDAITVYGSDTGDFSGEEETLDSFSSIFMPAQGSWGDWLAITSPSLYRYFRLSIAGLNENAYTGYIALAEVEFYEAGSDPSVTTDPATNMGASSATLNGTLDDLSGGSSVDVYFEWGIDTSYGNATTQETMSAIGSFSVSVSGLVADTTYHFRAAVTDGVDTWYGDDQTFVAQVIAELISQIPSFSLQMEMFNDGDIQATTPPLSMTVYELYKDINAQIPSLSLDMEMFNDGDIQATFPSLNMTITSGLAELEASLSGLSLDIQATTEIFGDIDASMPALSLDIQTGIVFAQFTTNLPSFDIDMYCGGRLINSLPSFSMTADLSKERPQPMEMSMPSFTMDMRGGGVFSEDIPSFALEMTGHFSPVGKLISTLPGLNMEAFIAGYFDVDLPMLTQTITATPTVLAAIESTLPGVRTSGFISRASEGDVEATLPLFRMSIQGIPGTVVAVTASLQPMYMSGTLIPSQVVNMDETLPKLRAAITAIRTGPAEIDGTLPVIRGLLQSGEIESNVLRYVKEKAR